jgi:hypothetical protein
VPQHMLEEEAEMDIANCQHWACDPSLCSALLAQLRDTWALSLSTSPTPCPNNPNDIHVRLNIYDALTYNSSAANIL